MNEGQHDFCQTEKRAAYDQLFRAAAKTVASSGLHPDWQQGFDLPLVETRSTVTALRSSSGLTRTRSRRRFALKDRSRVRCIMHALNSKLDTYVGAQRVLTLDAVRIDDQANRDASNASWTFVFLRREGGPASGWLGRTVGASTAQPGDLLLEVVIPKFKSGVPTVRCTRSPICWLLEYALERQ